MTAEQVQLPGLSPRAPAGAGAGPRAFRRSLVQPWVLSSFSSRPLLILPLVFLSILAHPQGLADTPDATQKTSSPPSAAQPLPPALLEVLKQLDILWNTRRQDPAVVAQMGSQLEKLVKAHGERYELLWRQARHQWWLADGETDRGKMEQAARKGWDYGKKAVKLSPRSVEGNFWTSVCIGQYSLAIGVLRALKDGLEGEFNQYLDTSIKIDKAFAGAGPLRTKGNYWKSLPWPFQRLDKAESTLKEALKISPEGMRTRLYLAETYAEKKDKRAAIAECDKIIKARSDEVEVGDYPRILARATALKQHLLED